MAWLKLIGNIGKRVVKAGEETYNQPKRRKKRKTKKPKTKKVKTMQKGKLKKIACAVGREALDYYSYKQAKKEIPTPAQVMGKTVNLPTVASDTVNILGKQVNKKTVYLTGGLLLAGLIGYKFLKRK